MQLYRVTQPLHARTLLLEGAHIYLTSRKMEGTIKEMVEHEYYSETTNAHVRPVFLMHAARPICIGVIHGRQDGSFESRGAKRGPYTPCILRKDERITTFSQFYHAVAVSKTMPVLMDVFAQIPRALDCGCCTEGCVCIHHASPKALVHRNVCGYHTWRPFRERTVGLLSATLGLNHQNARTAQ